MSQRRGSTPSGGKPERRIRVRSKRLDQVDETKLALAVWLMAKRIVEDRTDKAVDASAEGDAVGDSVANRSEPANAEDGGAGLAKDKDSS